MAWLRLNANFWEIPNVRFSPFKSSVLYLYSICSIRNDNISVNARKNGIFYLVAKEHWDWLKCACELADFLLIKMCIKKNGSNHFNKFFAICEFTARYLMRLSIIKQISDWNLVFMQVWIQSEENWLAIKFQIKVHFDTLESFKALNWWDT